MLHINQHKISFNINDNHGVINNIINPTPGDNIVAESNSVSSVSNVISQTEAIVQLEVPVDTEQNSATPHHPESEDPNIHNAEPIPSETSSSHVPTKLLLTPPGLKQAVSRVYPNNNTSSPPSSSHTTTNLVINTGKYFSFYLIISALVVNDAISH